MLICFCLPGLAAGTFTVHADNLSVRVLIQNIAKVLHQNIIMTDEVKGNVSLNLQGVTWREALTVLLKTQGLIEERLGNTIVVMPEKRYLERQQLSLNAKKQLAELGPLASVLIPIKYANAKTLATLLSNKENGFLSKRGRVNFDARTNTLLLEDVPAKIQSVQSLVKRLDVPIKQVLIKARIVNADRKYEQEIGVRLGLSRPRHLSGTLEGATELAKGIPAAKVPIAQRLNFDMPATVLFDHPGSVGLSVAKLGGGVLLDLELSAMERQHMLDIIASPRLIASHSEKALIESGMEIPYEQRSDGGATSAAFKKAVMSLQVIPQITPDHKILLTVEINHDKPGEQTNKGLAVKTQHLETQVLVNDKQTVMIGGVYETTKENAVDKVPFFGDLPLLGYLFRHKLVVNDKRELIIFITPQILSDKGVA